MGHYASEMSLDKELTEREKKCEGLRDQILDLPLSMITIGEIEKLEEFRRKVETGSKLSGEHWSDTWTNESILFWESKIKSLPKKRKAAKKS